MKKKLNIMHITNSLDIGGLENLILNMLGKIDKDKYCSCICTFKKKGKLIQEFKKEKIHVYVLEKKQGIDFSLPFRLKHLLCQRQIDVIHTHNYGPWLYATVAAKMTKGKKIIHTEHSNVDNLGRRKILEKILSYFTTCIVSDSQKVTDFMIRKQGIHKNKIKTILNGIDTKKFKTQIDKASLKQNLDIEKETLVVGTVGRLVEIKDQMTLLKSFKILVEEFKNIKLLIVGDGPLRESLEQFTKDNDIEEHVLFLGARRDLNKILQLIDVFVLSSLSEGLSLSLIEAMAAGIPVVATAVGGNCEVVIDSKVGFLVPPKSPDKMAKVINAILNDKDLSRKMAKNAKKRAEEYFNVDEMVKQYEQLYTR